MKIIYQSDNGKTFGDKVGALAEDLRCARAKVAQMAIELNRYRLLTLRVAVVRYEHWRTMKKETIYRMFAATSHKKAKKCWRSNVANYKLAMKDAIVCYRKQRAELRNARESYKQMRDNAPQAVIAKLGGY